MSGERGHDGTRGSDEARSTSLRPGGGRPKRDSHSDDRPTGIYGGGAAGSHADGTTTLGRWPANVVLDQEAAAVLDKQAGERKSGYMKPGQRWIASLGGGGYHGDMPDEATAAGTYGDQGGPSRFFYCAKADREEREAGCRGLPARSGAQTVEREQGSLGTLSPRAGAGRLASRIHNHHPTVKPLDLMRWLVRLVTPADGEVLDPFAGSGSTGCAAVLEGRSFHGIDESAEYCAIARARIAFWERHYQPPLPLAPP